MPCPYWEPREKGEKMAGNVHGSIANTPVRSKTIGIDIDADNLVTAFLDVSQARVPIRTYPLS
jgi:hypothetical protein